LVDPHRDPTPIGRELERIAQEAPQHVVDLLAVAQNLLGLALGDQPQVDAPTVSLRLETLD
jgi:hypothetical protein